MAPLLLPLLLLAAAAPRAGRAQSQGLCNPGTFWQHSAGRLLHTRMTSLPLKLQPQFGPDAPPRLGRTQATTDATQHLALNARATPCDNYPSTRASNLLPADAALLAKTPWHWLAPMHRGVDDEDSISSPTANGCSRQRRQAARASLRSGAVHLALHEHRASPPHATVLYATPPPIAPRPTIPLYWINLADDEGQSATRRRAMQEQISRLGWTGIATTVDAVDGRRGPLSNEALLMPSSYSFHNISALPCHLRACNSRELATLLSHVKAVRQAFADGAALALVAEDDADLSLFDEAALREVIIPRLPWSSVQLYTGNTHILQHNFGLPPGAIPVDFRQTAWGHALTLYSRRGMAEILDAFGGRDEAVHGGRFRIPHPSDIILGGAAASAAAFQFEADWFLKLVVSRPMISTRPMANVFVAESTIDNFNRKGTGADVVIGNHSHLLLGAGRALLYGSPFEIQRTARHLRAIAEAYDAGASSVIISEDELDVAQVRLGPLAVALRAAQAQGVDSIVQLVTSNEAATASDDDSSGRLLTVVPRPNVAMGGALFYAVVGRTAMGRYAALWDGKTNRVRVPAEQTFVADAFLFRSGAALVLFAPHVVHGTQTTIGDWMGFNKIQQPRRLAGTCQTCPAGYFQPYQHTSNCSACPLGYFTKYTGSIYCNWCPEGWIGPTPATLACTLCLRGQFQHRDGAWCNNCSAGMYQNEDGLRACKDCPTGWRRANSTIGTECTACETGRFQDAERASNCRDCTAGRHAKRQGSGDCTDCNAGRYAEKTAAENCAACPAGWHRHWNYPKKTECLECAEGFFQQEQGQYACHSCMPGQYSNAPGSAFCASCAPGRFSAEDEALTCEPCPTGSIADTPGSASCAACDAGQYRHNETACRECPSGRYTGSNRGAESLNSCLLCAVGQFKDNPTCTRPCALCDKCTPGTHQDEKGKSSCKFCDAGQTTAIEAAAHCSKCAVGKYITASMAASATAAAGCLPCATATGIGTKSCEGCPAGEYGNSNAKGCTACPAGRYSTGGQTCAKHGTGTSLSFLAPCDNHTAEQGCKECPLGWFGTLFPRFCCLACPAGTWSSTPQASNGSVCQKCGRGKYSGITAAKAQETCTECPPGTRNPHEGADHSTRCEMCKSGFYALDTAQRWKDCVGCVPGRFNAQRGSYLRCEACPHGQHQLSANGSVCEACLPGKSQSWTGQASCEGCAPGMYAASSAQQSCDYCPQGYFNAKSGQASCLPCIPGRYSDFAGQTTCKACKRNTFSMFVNSSSCITCPSGRSTSRP